MSASLPRPSSVENVSTSLSSGITDVASSMDVADASNIVSPCYLVIDRVDSAGTQKTTSLWEYVKVTNVSSNTLTITRGQNGSTQQAHSSGAVVEAVVTSAMFEDWYTALNPEHTASGGHIMDTATVNYLQSFNLAVTSAASISSLAVTNALIGINSTASAAVAEFNIRNASGNLLIKPGASKVVATQQARQDNTNNTYEFPVVTQYGWSFTSGASSTSSTRLITFPMAYSAAPVVITSVLGIFGGGSLPSTVADFQTNTSAAAIAKSEAINSTPTGFTLAMSSTDPQVIGRLHGASWIALGKI